MTPLLSILIPTVAGRTAEWNNILEKIFSQSNLSRTVGKHFKCDTYWNNYWRSEGCDVEVISFFDEKTITIGEKRELLYKEANGLYSWQIDDDDSISNNAIELILNAIKENNDVDCITFEENCMMNGKYYKSNHSLRYNGWYGDGSHLLHDGFHYHRSPFYKDVIKTEIARSVPFKHCRFGEDHLWAIDLLPHLKTEVHIPQELYFYSYEPKESFEERYGINK